MPTAAAEEQLTPAREVVAGCSRLLISNATESVAAPAAGPADPAAAAAGWGPAAAACRNQARGRVAVALSCVPGVNMSRPDTSVKAGPFSTPSAEEEQQSSQTQVAEEQQRGSQTQAAERQSQGPAAEAFWPFGLLAFWPVKHKEITAPQHSASGEE